MLRKAIFTKEEAGKGIALTSKCREYFQKQSHRELEFLEQIFSGFDAELTEGVY